MNQEQREFPISIYGNVEPVNDTLSRARCRIFYKGGNRNGTFITDDFARELISTLHYVPIKGIYDGDDYTDHGTERSEGKIYGIVPMDNNFAWEQHLDDDGVMRTYACTDVLLFSALYPEAEEILGKGQSMELYEPSLVYHQAILQGRRYVVFEHGSFLGLQVLGDDVEPCFEGASFFSLQESIQNIIQRIKEYDNTGGKSEMHINFKLSDNQKFEYLWALLNPEFDEEHGWACGYSICSIYDEYAICFNYESGSYERVYYSKDDATDSVELGDRIPVYIVDVTEEEKNVLDTLTKLNGGTYELVDENLINAEKNAQDCLEYSAKIEELQSTNTTLNTEVENVTAQYTNAQSRISELEEENAALNTYKHNIEVQHKECVIDEYLDKLTEEVIDTYRAKLDEYTAEELDMHLAYELKKTGTSIFSNNAPEGFIPKGNEYNGVEAILANYKR